MSRKQPSPPEEDANTVSQQIADLQSKLQQLKRNADIEAALESVRTASMSMQLSQDLLKVITVVYHQLETLGLKIHSANIIDSINDTQNLSGWSVANSQVYSEKVYVPITKNRFFSRFRDAIENNEPSYALKLSKAQKNNFFQNYFENSSQRGLVPKTRQEFIYSCPGLDLSVGVGKHSALIIMRYDGIPYRDEENEIVKRFAEVFEQSYTRFLDLEKAEAQAREAQIEAALERVRAASMAMHQSEDLFDVVTLVFDQLSLQGIQMDSSMIIENHEDSKDWVVWAAAGGQNYSDQQRVPYLKHDLYDRLESARKEGLEFFEDRFTKAQKDEWFTLIFTKSTLDTVPNDRKKYIYDKEGLSRSVVLTKNVSFTFFRYSLQSFSVSENDLFKRFARVFEQAYARFLDIQKAEAQAREAQIEVALERVRARTMAMHNSVDVGNTVSLMFEQLDKLNISTVRCGLGICLENYRLEAWTAKASSTQNVEKIAGYLDMKIHPLLTGVYDAWRGGKKFNEYDLKGRDLIKYFKALNKAPEYPISFDLDLLPTRQFHSTFFFQEGVLYVFTEEPLSQDNQQVFTRFAGVFGQTYRRYLDLQKAEAQAREAQIEAGLERVRSSAMAMHRSEDLPGVLNVIFEQMHSMGFAQYQSMIAIINEENNVLHYWSQAMPGFDIPLKFDIPFIDHPYLNKLLEDWKSNTENSCYHLKGKEKRTWDKHVFSTPGLSVMSSKQKDALSAMPEVYLSLSYMKNGVLYANGPEPLSSEKASILNRFAKVLDLTYTRMLDLQKAEAQAREARIEAALERVRAKAMAMHSSEDLSLTVDVFFSELEHLNVKPQRCGVGIVDRDSRVVQVSASAITDNNKSEIITADLILKGHPVLNKIFDCFLTQKEYQPILRGKEIKEYYQVMNPEVAYPDIEENDIEYGYYFFFKEGGVFAWTNNELPKRDIEIFRRFNSVLSLTYRRYMDLLEAEAQTREALIEASLERLRTQAMSMRHSDDLIKSTTILFEELEKLDLAIKRSGIGIFDLETKDCQLWTMVVSKEGKMELATGVTSMTIHPMLIETFDAWVNQEPVSYVLEGKDLADYYKIISKGDFHLSQEAIGISASLPKEYYQYTPFGAGGFYFFSDVKPLESDKQIIARFAEVFNLTYTRYEDLQKAEERAKDATKQAALERVRGEIASMRSKEDLNRIPPLVWNELKTLEVPFIRCGVFIINEQMEQVEVHLSSAEGQALGSLNLGFDSNELTASIIKHWQKKNIYHHHWTQKEFLNWTKMMVKEGQVKNKKTYLGMDNAPESLDLHYIPFTQGMIYVGSKQALNKEEITLVQSLADSFAIAYARYDDFVKLEKAKESIELTLSELRSTQTQLIQSEKMASLGELTAGIAHEIQNPLNFVNNFSDVSGEMIDEAVEEFTSTPLSELTEENIREVKDILSELKGNLEKISHHGNRASSIVKGMLDHSRTNSGEKVLTDINALCDEYLRLSYHARLSGRQGSQDRDKSFNCGYKTQFQDDLPKIKVIPQELGRVVLNIINNAFYACSARSARASADRSGGISADRSVSTNLKESTSRSAVTSTRSDAKGSGRRRPLSHQTPTPESIQEEYKPIVTITTQQLNNLPAGQAGFAIITIKDNGIGMSQETIDKVFQPFFTTKPTGQGTGLGMSISYDIITKVHGGELRVESEVGVGTQIIISLPIA